MTHTPRPPFAATAGASRPKIVLVGEAWGETEEQCWKPFAGESGKELFRMLGEAMPHIEPELHLEICKQHNYGAAWVRQREEWLAAAGIAMTNVLAFRPPGNKLDDLCGTKKEVSDYAGSFAPLTRGKYLREEFLSELERLQRELSHWRPNLVVALGNSACWALLQATNIGSIRGAITQSNGCTPRGGFEVVSKSESGNESAYSYASGLQDTGGVSRFETLKVLPTYHPAGVLRQWAWRPIVVADLMKASREADFPDIRRPKRRVLVSPTVEEMVAWTSDTLLGFAQGKYHWLSPDVETASGQITCIGFARSPGEAMVIPFWDRKQPGYNYWQDPRDEHTAWECMARLLQSEMPKVGQNFIYDLQYITRVGIQPKALVADTMLLHHSLFPELQKGLGFLGSIYTNEQSWKLMRKRKADSEKKDE